MVKFSLAQEGGGNWPALYDLHQQLRKDKIVRNQVNTTGHCTILMYSAEEAWKNGGINTDSKSYPCNYYHQVGFPERLF